MEAGDPQQHIWARLLGFLILEAPTVNSRFHIAQEILQCNSDGEQMDLLAQFYMDHLLRLCEHLLCSPPSPWLTFLSLSPHLLLVRSKTPAPSHHPSRPSFEEHSAFFATAIEPAPKDHRSAKRAVGVLFLRALPALNEWLRLYTVMVIAAWSPTT